MVSVRACVALSFMFCLLLEVEDWEEGPWTTTIRNATWITDETDGISSGNRTEREMDNENPWISWVEFRRTRRMHEIGI